MTGLEANLRFAGPETMETKIFGRLTAWQNWIFQRPNAVGDEGRAAILRRAGTTGIRLEAHIGISELGFQSSDWKPSDLNSESEI